MLRDLTKEAARQEPLRREDDAKGTRAKVAEKPASPQQPAVAVTAQVAATEAVAPADAEVAADASPPAPMPEMRDALASNMAAPASQPFAAGASGEVAMLAEPPPPAAYHDEGRDKFQTSPPIR